MRVVAVGALALGLACASADRRGGEDYFRWVPFRVPINEDVVLRWPEREMPLQVHLPEPPDGLFDDSEAVYSRPIGSRVVGARGRES